MMQIKKDVYTYVSEQDIEGHKMDYESLLKSLYKNPQARKETLTIWEGFQMYMAGIAKGMDN